MSEFGIGERAPRDDGVDLALPREERVAHRPDGFVGRRMREQEPAGDVAGDVDRVDGRPPAIVDDNSSRTNRDTKLVQSKTCEGGHTPDRDEELVASPRAGLAGQSSMHDLLAARDGDVLDLDVAADVDA